VQGRRRLLRLIEPRCVLRSCHRRLSAHAAVRLSRLWRAVKRQGLLKFRRIGRRRRDRRPTVATSRQARHLHTFQLPYFPHQPRRGVGCGRLRPWPPCYSRPQQPSSLLDRGRAGTRPPARGRRRKVSTPTRRSRHVLQVCATRRRWLGSSGPTLPPVTPKFRVNRPRHLRWKQRADRQSSRL
jgi:hypothetical protein